MAHLVESYALNCGVKINKPFILDTYFPVPYDKYILIHAGGGMPAKLYEYYTEVVQIIQDTLRKNGYEILQIGGPNDPPVAGVASVVGQTNIHQTAYLIKNASLLIGNDSCNVHIASGYDVPVISLYGPTTPWNHGPYFSSSGKFINLAADLQGNKPSYLPDERPKTINRIKPEDVAKNVYKILGIKSKISFKTINVGNKFNDGGLDIVPNCVVAANIAQNVIPQIRLDYLYNINGLVHNLRTRRQIIITDKPFDPAILATFKANIQLLLYEVKEDSSPEFIAEVKRIGIPYHLYSSLEGEDLGKAKLDFFDYGIILELKYENVDEILANKNINEKTLFKSNRFLVSDSQIYLSKSHWEKKLPIKGFNDNVQPVLLGDREFFKHSEYYYIFNK